MFYLLNVGVVDEGIGPKGELVAIKRELASDKVTRGILEHEYHVYQALAGHFCIPEVKPYGRQHRHNLMVVDLLGPSLGDRFRQCSSRFSLGTTARLAVGMVRLIVACSYTLLNYDHCLQLDAIGYIHSRGFIHRNIKPENFLLGLGAKSHVVHLIDFGFARRLKHSTIVTYVPSSTPEEGLSVIGTLKYASKYAHLGQGTPSSPFWLCTYTDPSSAQTRRDALQPLVYTILLFARGSLPWDHIRRGTRKHCARRILEKKRSWTAERLCQGLPHELEAFSSYCFGLEISEEPNYHLLRDKLAAIANRERCNMDINFEWDDPDWTGECCITMSAHSCLNMCSAAPIAPEPALSLLEHAHSPRIKRGDIVLLKLILEKSLDYEPPPRSLDASFFPHQNLTGVEWRPPFRPAVVRRVISEKGDPTYFTVEVYPLMRRTGLTGLSSRRRRSFLPLETLIDTTTGIQVPSDNMFVYKTSLLNGFKIEYDEVRCSLHLQSSRLTGFGLDKRFYFSAVCTRMHPRKP